jgi:hypothetical protein
MLFNVLFCAVELGTHEKMNFLKEKEACGEKAATVANSTPQLNPLPW